MKWTKPTETGGLPLEYVVEMNPPPGKDSVNGVYPSTLDVSFCLCNVHVGVKYDLY